MFSFQFFFAIFAREKEGIREVGGRWGEGEKLEEIIYFR
jgi:hypothetical protein